MDPTYTSARFESVYRKLIIEDIKRQIPIVFVRENVSDDDIAYALSVASRLALLSSGATVESATSARKAYEVAVRTLGLGNGSAASFRAASDLILSRLGNFPARQLLRKRNGLSSNEQATTFKLEILAREFENRVSAGEQQTYLTDFQMRLLSALEQKTYVSVSAPTSAGKSFTLELEILRQLSANPGYCVVYLVPTRALIRQVTFDLIQTLREHLLLDVQVLSVPSVPGTDSLERRTIYVLTQERFSALLFSDTSRLVIDALVVDEAQEIAEIERGQTLESVIQTALQRYTNLKVFFSSPLKSNPEYLLSLFSRSAGCESFVEYSTPVTQNIINIYPVKGRGNTNRARFESWLDGQSTDMGVVELPFKFRRPHIHSLAAHLTGPDDTSIIYCNEPSSADRNAQSLAEMLEFVDEGSEALEDLSDFLTSHIHADYRLAALLRKGVAFHYGNIPQIIRGRIEELLKERALRFVCCTSTLLQGMNLPAKNIFVENPKKGRGRPMSTGDFWNLVGRAGRMAKEFNGNVFCVHGVTWETKPLEGSRLDKIKSAFASAVTDKVADLAAVASSPPPSTETDLAWAEQAIARIYSDFIVSGALISKSEFATDANIEALNAIDRSIIEFNKRKTLPDAIHARNIYLHPARLEDLAQAFRAPGGAMRCIPPNPYASRSYDGLVAVFETLENVFFRTGHKSYRYDAFLALEWMQGNSLKSLISQKIEWNRATGDVGRINELIRELFDEVESRLRFKYVKYMKTYDDVLRALLEEQGRSEEIKRIPPIHLFLEYGAANVTLINLIAIGLSRTSSILLKTARGLRDELSITECQQEIENIDTRSSTLPAICTSEIRRLQRRR